MRLLNLLDQGWSCPVTNTRGVAVVRSTSRRQHLVAVLLSMGLFGHPNRNMQTLLPPWQNIGSACATLTSHCRAGRPPDFGWPVRTPTAQDHL